MAFQLDSNVYSKQRSLSDYMAVNQARDLQKAVGERSIEASDMAIDAAKQKAVKDKIGLILAQTTPENYAESKAAIEAEGFPVKLPDSFEASAPIRDAILTATGYKPDAGSTPASIQEYSFYNKLQPPEQEKYLNIKRAQQVVNLGGSQIVRSPTGGVAETYEVTPKPEQMPDFKGQQAQAVADVDLANKPLIERETTAARLEAGREDEAAKKEIKAENILPIIKEAREILPVATSGGLGQTVKSVKGYFGTSTEASQADRRLNVLSAALTANVPRMEGPQGVLDVEMYKQAAADVGNPDIPREDRLAALDTAEKLQKQYASKPAAAQGGLQVGAVEDGYEYLGGDPSNPESWRAK